MTDDLTCPRCGRALGVAVRSGSLFVTCTDGTPGRGGCPWRPIMTDGRPGGREWCAVSSAGGWPVLLAVGTEQHCFDEMLRRRRALGRGHGGGE